MVANTEKHTERSKLRKASGHKHHAHTRCLNLKAVVWWNGNVLCSFSIPGWENERETKTDTLERQRERKWRMENAWCAHMIPMDRAVLIRPCTSLAFSCRVWQDHSHLHTWTLTGRTSEGEFLHVCDCRFLSKWFLYMQVFLYVCVFMIWFVYARVLRPLWVWGLSVTECFQKGFDSRLTVEEDGWVLETRR